MVNVIINFWWIKGMYKRSFLSFPNHIFSLYLLLFQILHPKATNQSTKSHTLTASGSYYKNKGSLLKKLVKKKKKNNKGGWTWSNNYYWGKAKMWIIPLCSRRKKTIKIKSLNFQVSLSWYYSKPGRKTSSLVIHDHG